MSYLDSRDNDIDTTEWIDIYTALKALKPGRDELIVELCAGKGYLIRFLGERIPSRIIGVDLEGCRYSRDVECLNLALEDPPQADIYVFQHCIEHLPQERAKCILKRALVHGRAVVGILPGHHVDDPTHKINHYHIVEIKSIIDYVRPPYYVVRPDIRSYAYPGTLDYLLVMSNTPIRKEDTVPRRLALLVKAYRSILARSFTPKPPQHIGIGGGRHG